MVNFPLDSMCYLRQSVYEGISDLIKHSDVWKHSYRPAKFYFGLICFCLLVAFTFLICIHIKAEIPLLRNIHTNVVRSKDYVYLTLVWFQYGSSVNSINFKQVVGCRLTSI